MYASTQYGPVKRPQSYPLFCIGPIKPHRLPTCVSSLLLQHWKKPTHGGHSHSHLLGPRWVTVTAITQSQMRSLANKTKHTVTNNNSGLCTIVIQVVCNIQRYTDIPPSQDTRGSCHPLKQAGRCALCPGASTHPLYHHSASGQCCAVFYLGLQLSWPPAESRIPHWLWSFTSWPLLGTVSLRCLCACLPAHQAPSLHPEFDYHVTMADILCVLPPTRREGGDLNARAWVLVDLHTGV